MGEGLSVLPPSLPSVRPPDDPAREAMARAVSMMQSGQFAVATFFWRQAAEAFDEQCMRFLADSFDAQRLRFFAEYCRAMADLAEGSDFSLKGDRPKAVDQLTRAINRFNGNVLPLVDHIDQPEFRDTMRTGVIADLTGAKIGKYIAQMMEDIFNDDFDSALLTAADIFQDLDKSMLLIDDSVSQINTSTIPDPDGEHLKQLNLLRDNLKALRLALKGLQSYAEAEKANVAKDWKKALDTFTTAKRLLRDARDAYSASPILASHAQIWQSFVDMGVQPAQRRCKKLQQMWEELERYKAGMVDVARAVGAADVTSTTIVQTTQEINAKIDIQTTIINRFEDRTRTALDGLLAVIEAAPVEQERRKTAVAAIKEVTDTHGSSFFDKFQKFCDGSVGIVGDIAKVAGPVATAWNVFAPFFGMPPLPLPVK